MKITNRTVRVVPSAARNLLFLLPSRPKWRDLSSHLLLMLLFALPSFAQVQTGTPPFGSFSGGPDVINNANLNAHWAVPIFHKPGRGINFSYDLVYESSSAPNRCSK